MWTAWHSEECMKAYLGGNSYTKRNVCEMWWATFRHQLQGTKLKLVDDSTSDAALSRLARREALRLLHHHRQ